MEWMEPVISNDDKLIVYLIVRSSLNMSAGKIGAQCGHAIQLLMDKFLEEALGAVAPSNKTDRISLWRRKDINGGFTKVVLAANEKEWDYFKSNTAGYDPIVVTDAGHTEVEPNTETVMALYPMLKSERCNKLKRLRLL